MTIVGGPLRDFDELVRAELASPVDPAVAAVIAAARDAVAEAAERERIALHANEVAAARIEMIGRRVAAHLASTREVTWQRRLKELLALSYEADQDVNEAAHALGLLETRRDDVVASLRALAVRFTQITDVACYVNVGGDTALISDPLAEVLFRVAHEALLNAGRHARATLVSLELAVEDVVVRLLVRDDGIGLLHRDPFAVPGRFGLRTMRDRVRHVNGHVSVAARSPRGLTIEAALPLERTS